MAMSTRSTILSLAVAATLFAAGTARAQETAPADTREWTCSKCPFDKGFRSTAELGVAYLDESAARFGDSTGLDEEGEYLLAAASGTSSDESGYQVSYDVVDLGLDAREIRVEGGRQGSYDFEFFYDGVPRRIADTGETIYSGLGSNSLELPPGWVRAGSTAGMSALDDSLRGVDIGYDRDRYGVAGRAFWGENLQFTLDYRRDERDGTRPIFGSFGSVSTQLLRPVDDATDRFTVAARYQGEKWFAEAGYYLSLYDTQAAQLRWGHAFNSFVPDATTGRMALEPDNQYQEIAVRGGLHGLPWNTTVAVSLASGQGSQDVSYLPYTITPGIATDPLPTTNLDGDLSVMRADLSVSMRPLDRLRLRGTVAWDERDNESRTSTFTSIVHTDLFPIGEDRVNPAYGFERLRMFGTADYDVYDDLSVGVGGELRTLDRTGTRQEVRSEDLTDGWVRAQYRPSGYLGIVLKGGIEERDPDRYDVALGESLGQNSLMRKYNMAYRYRSYAEAMANVALGSLPLSLGFSGFYADDEYNQSEIGLRKGLDRRVGVDLSWTVNDKVTAYATAGREKISADTSGSSVFAAPDWNGRVRDDFTSGSVGLRMQLAEGVTLDLDYTEADGETDTEVAGDAFPTVESSLRTLRADFGFQLGEHTEFVFGWWYEHFDSEDWALQGIGPGTVPTVLALGIDPYNYSVNYITASLRYRFGPRGIQLPE
jgi:MtrB/PioB family decaheme-associated outer membrane protein